MKYFVSYFYNIGNNSGFGNTIFDSNKKICNHEDLTNISEQLKILNKINDLTILNYREV